MRSAILAIAVLMLPGCDTRPSFWDGATYVVNKRLGSDDYYCAVTGVLMLGHPSAARGGATPVIDRAGLPVACRWMTDAERDQ